MSGALRYGRLREAAHLCVDMQNLFAERTDWHLPWMARIPPVVGRIAAAHPGHTIFTRFILPERAENADGPWVRYYVPLADIISTFVTRSQRHIRGPECAPVWRHRQPRHRSRAGSC